MVFLIVSGKLKKQVDKNSYLFRIIILYICLIYQSIQQKKKMTDYSEIERAIGKFEEQWRDLESKDSRLETQSQTERAIEDQHFDIPWTRSAYIGAKNTTANQQSLDYLEVPWPV